MAIKSGRVAANAVLLRCWELLAQRAADPGFSALIQDVFGVTAAAATQLKHQLSRGSIKNLKVVELSSGEMNGALGAYSPSGTAQRPTIYVNSALLAPDRDPARLQSILLEEIGHHFDQILNPGQDTAGDEGQLFASRVLGKDLATAQIAALKSEIDIGFVHVQGQTIAVEQAASSISATNSGTYTAAADSLDCTVNVNTLTTGGQDLLVAAYAANSTLISWQVVNRTANFTSTSTSHSGTFNFAAPSLSRIDTNGIRLLVWQGSAGSSYSTTSVTYGNGNIATGATKGFAANSVTASSSTSGTISLWRDSRGDCNRDAS
jgi:hypothetical protein